MRISLKTIIWLWVLLLVIMGAMFVGAYKKLEPESLISVLNEQAQKNYPGSRLEITESNYRFALDFNMTFKNIILTRSGKILTNIKEIELKIPWWVIFFNKGNAQINVSDLSIYVEDQAESIPSEKAKVTDNSKVKVVLPSYLVNAQYTLRAKNLQVRNVHTGRSYLTISKFLVREFQYGKNSAFELNLPIEITHKDTKYNSQLWLFGDVTPTLAQWNLHYRGEFKTRETSDRFQLEDMIIEGKASFNPAEFDFISFYNLTMEGKQIGNGRINAKHHGFRVHTDFTKLPLSYLSLVGDEVKNPYRVATDNTAQGSVDFSKKFGEAGLATVSGRLSFNGGFKLDEKNSFSGLWKMNFENTRWETSFMSPKGEISYFHRAHLDFDKGIMSQYSQELGLNNLEFTLVNSIVPSLSQLDTITPESFFTSEITFKNAAHNDQVHNGSVKFGRTPDKKYFSAEFQSNKSNIKFDYQKKLEQHQVAFSSKSFDWNPSMSFMKPYFSMESGMLNGKLQGRWDESWNTGTWLGDITFNDPVNPQGEMIGFMKETLNAFELNLTPAKKIVLNFTSSKNVIKVKSFSVDSADLAVLSGSLSILTNANSSLTLSYPKNKKWKPVSKSVDTLSWQKE